MIWSAGYNSPANTNVSEYVNFATLGNGTDFCDMTRVAYTSTAGCDQST